MELELGVGFRTTNRTDLQLNTTERHTHPTRTEDEREEDVAQGLDHQHELVAARLLEAPGEELCFK